MLPWNQSYPLTKPPHCHGASPVTANVPAIAYVTMVHMHPSPLAENIIPSATSAIQTCAVTGLLTCATFGPCKLHALERQLPGTQALWLQVLEMYWFNYLRLLLTWDRLWQNVVERMRVALMPGPGLGQNSKNL